MNLLHEHGHANPERYTPAQIYLYIEAIDRADSRARLHRINDYRTAAFASDDGFAKYVRPLKTPSD